MPPPLGGAAPASTPTRLPAAAAKAQACTPPDPRIVAVHNSLGLRLLQQLSAGSSANIALSPLGIGLVLAIL